jgi:hypothetical protein
MLCGHRIPSVSNAFVPIRLSGSSVHALLAIAFSHGRCVAVSEFWRRAPKMGVWTFSFCEKLGVCEFTEKYLFQPMRQAKDGETRESISCRKWLRLNEIGTELLWCYCFAVPPCFGFKIRYPQGCVGSTPTFGTKHHKDSHDFTRIVPFERESAPPALGGPSTRKGRQSVLLASYSRSDLLCQLCRQCSGKAPLLGGDRGL